MAYLTELHSYISHHQIQFISKNMFSLKKQPYFLFAIDRQVYLRVKNNTCYFIILSNKKGSYTLLASHNLGQGNNEVKSNKVDYQKNYYARVAWVTWCWTKKMNMMIMIKKYKSNFTYVCNHTVFQVITVKGCHRAWVKRSK